MNSWLNVVIAGLLFCTLPTESNIQQEIVESWATQLGTELWFFGNKVSRRKEMQESFKDAKVKVRDGQKLVQEIVRGIKNMMDLKISAVKRIMDTAENSAMASQTEGAAPPKYPYFNSKTLETVVEGTKATNSSWLYVKSNSNFFNEPVNTSVSSVHVPTNVYDRAPDVIDGIKWSSNLDRIFISNYKLDPSLSWQYFGSSTGFMRQFPAAKWEQVPAGPVDLYDCRTRAWYIEAATSPKDILILVDNSGSMMGQRKEIARHVVNNILDTLGSNDYVNVFSFVKDTIEVVSCFKGILVQANLANIRELKLGMERMVAASNIANFSVALPKAFEILQMYREERLGAACNQAIMLITDGVPYNFKEIFEEYNWRHFPSMPVRVFTYLIGKEVADVRDVKWMACANRGYYVHLSTMAEVREQVLQYVPVMARPMVLGKSVHPVIWTPVYADIIDPKMTDWLWEMKERAKQKDRSMSFRRPRIREREEEDEHKQFLREQMSENEKDTTFPYKMMTSVSMPVYDRRENATKVANLLGVAGIDVPNSDIQRLMLQYLLGVNAYGFIVTNNGYILIHPDFRPVFQGILKPSYNNIDITEIELLDDDSAPREFHHSLLELREKLINQSNGSDTLAVKYHYDNLRRVSRGKRRYYYNVIGGTPFELIIALPDPYGLYQIDAELEVKRFHAKGGVFSGKRVFEYFSGKNWKIHPEWFYCKYLYGDEFHFKTPEEELYHFLRRTAAQGWKWPLQRHSSPPEHQGNSTKSEAMDKSSYFCDRTLILSLVFDAIVTEWFSGNLTATNSEEKGPIAKLMALMSRKDMKQRFGLALVFMATRSGLTRWQDISINSEVEEETDVPHFSEVHNKAIDEIWYRRAVEQYLVDPESFVYSVPFDAGDSNDSLVTATHAVFHTEGLRSAPAAVVGYQFHHSALHARFLNISSMCEKCEKTCAHSDIECFVLDNHGYVILSEERKDTGKFYGEVKGNVMEYLINNNVYKRVQIFDYQAVCFAEVKTESSSCNKIYTPFSYIGFFLNWIFGNALWIMIKLNLPIASNAFYQVEDGVIYPENYEDSSEPPNTEMPISRERPVVKMMIKRTRPAPCDMEAGLYILQPENKHRHQADVCLRPYVAHNVPFSNLIMVVVDTLCKIPDVRTSVIPTKVEYNSSLSCHKVLWNKLPRRRPKVCINSHEKEEEIKLCGSAVQHTASMVTLAVLAYVSKFCIQFD